MTRRHLWLHVNHVYPYLAPAFRCFFGPGYVCDFYWQLVHQNSFRNLTAIRMNAHTITFMFLLCFRFICQSFCRLHWFSHLFQYYGISCIRDSSHITLRFSSRLERYSMWKGVNTSASSLVKLDVLRYSHGLFFFFFLAHCTRSNKGERKWFTGRVV